MEAMYRKSALAAAVSAMLLLAACGGGKESETAKAVDADDVPAITNPDDGLSDVQRLLQKAAEAGITKTAYTFSNQLAAYGKVLQADGWNIQQASPEAVPNEPTTVVIINAEAPGVDPDALYEQYKQFKGVLIVDSNKNTEGIQKRMMLWDEAKQNYVPDESAVEKSQSAEQDENYPAYDFLAALSRGELTQTPLGTAVMATKSAGRIMAIHVTPDGLVNGAAPSDRDQAVNPMLAALASKEASQQVVGKIGSAPGGWDLIADFSELLHGWRLAGRVTAEGLSAIGGNGQRRWFVAAHVNTGNNHFNCYVLGVKCGVYPTATNHVVFNLNHHTQGAAGVRIDVAGPANEYKAFLRANPAMTILEYGPTAAAWTNPNQRETDSFERSWSEGFSIGSGATLSSTNSFSVGLNMGYSRSTTHRAVTHRWAATSDPGDTAPYNSTGASMQAVTRIHISDWARTAIESQIYSHEEFLHPAYRHDSYGEGGRHNLRTWVLMGRHCRTPGNWATFAHMHRPRMAYEGWNPSISATFEAVPSRMNANTSTQSFVDVEGGVELVRPIYVLERRNDVKCTSDNINRWGYRVVHPNGTLAPSGYHTLGKDWNRWAGYQGKVKVRVTRYGTSGTGTRVDHFLN